MLPRWLFLVLAQRTQPWVMPVSSHLFRILCWPVVVVVAMALNASPLARGPKTTAPNECSESCGQDASQASCLLVLIALAAADQKRKVVFTKAPI